MAKPFRGQAEDELIDFLLGSDVDAARRLVEQQNPRIGRQPFADDDLLLVAARKRRHDLIDAGAAHREPFDHVGGERGFAGEGAKAEARERADRRQRDIVANRSRRDAGPRLAILGHQRDAERGRRRRAN